jgi:hypothetical protein
LRLEPRETGGEVVDPGGLWRLGEKLVEDGQEVVERSDRGETGPVGIAPEAAKSRQVKCCAEDLDRHGATVEIKSETAVGRTETERRTGKVVEFLSEGGDVGRGSEGGGHEGLGDREVLRAAASSSLSRTR